MTVADVPASPLATSRMCVAGFDRLQALCVTVDLPTLGGINACTITGSPDLVRLVDGHGHGRFVSHVAIVGPEGGICEGACDSP